MTIIDDINNVLTIDEVHTLVPGLELQGHNYIGRCPTGHDSQSGTSFQVNTISPTFNCFNCGAHGSYIHLVELVKFGQSSAGKGGTDSFKQTIRHLAEKYNLSNSDTYSKSESVFDIIECVIADYKRQLFKRSRPLLESVMRNYGLSEDFLSSESWGFGGECPSIRLSEFFTTEELLSTGLFNKSGKTSTGVFHIYQGRIIIPYNNFGRIKYTIGRKTSSTNKWGDKDPPKYFKQYINSVKRPYVSTAINNEIVSCSRDHDDVVITEGITDYLSLKMHNINSVSAVTTSFKKDEYEKVVGFCKKFNTVYIANDNDKNGAGQKGTGRICEMLIDAGVNPFIILLPRPDGQDKIDVAEFISKYGIDKFTELKPKAKTYLESLLDAIPADIDKAILMDALSDILTILSKQSQELAEVFIRDKIKKRFRLSSLPKLLTKMMQLTKTPHIDKSLTEMIDFKDKKDESIFEDNNTDIKLISSGQDYKEGVLYYTITRPQHVTDNRGIMKIINKAFLVTSNKKINELIDYQIITESSALTKKLNPDFICEYWSFKDSPYSVENYIKGDSKVNPAELYKKIKERILKHVYFKEDYEASFCAIVIMTSMVYMLFNATGYIHLWAEKRSGKTTLLEIFQMLGFNAKMSSSISDAALFRSIEMYRPILLMDEAENLNPSHKAKDNSGSEKLELLKSGYKKSGSAARCEGPNNSVVSYSNYCIKVFAGIKTLDQVLADRTIMIEMRRAKEDVKIEELIEEKIAPQITELRDMLYTFGMQYADDIKDIYVSEIEHYKEDLSDHKVTFRAKELWTPYLSVALLVDSYDDDLDVFGELLLKAKRAVETAEAFGGDSKSLEIVELLYKWTKNVQQGLQEDMTLYHDGDIYMRTGITDSFIKRTLKTREYEDDFEYVNYQVLKQLLRKFDVIDKECEHKTYNNKGKRGAALLLDPTRMLESLITYKKDHDEDVMEDIYIYKSNKGVPVEEQIFNMEDFD